MPYLVELKRWGGVLESLLHAPCLSRVRKFGGIIESLCALPCVIPTKQKKTSLLASINKGESIFEAVGQTGRSVDRSIGRSAGWLNSLSVDPWNRPRGKLSSDNRKSATDQASA